LEKVEGLLSVLDGFFLGFELESHLVYSGDEIGELLIFFLEYFLALFEAVELLVERLHLGVILGEFGLGDSLKAFVLGFETGVLGLDFL
jgi:hypothetical protein